MFKFFSGLFGKQSHEEEILFSNVDEWFDSKVKEDLGLYEELDDIYTELNDEVRKLQMNLNILEKAELRNKNIPERALQLMNGNRESYIKKVKDFLKQIDLPDKNNIVNLKGFTERLSNSINELNKSTVKQYYILQEFFANESKDIALSIKRLDDLRKKIANLIERDFGFNYVYDVHERIKKIEQKIMEEEKLNEQLEEAEIKLKEAKAQKEKIETDIDNLETSEQFQMHSENKSAKIRLETELKRHRENFSLFFNPIMKALAKYQRVAFESDKELLNEYLISPVEALERDKGLRVLNLLKNVVYKLNEIETDDKKREKVREAINKFNELYIKDFLWKYSAVKEKIVEIDKRLKTNTINNDINDLNYKMKHAEEQIKKLELEITKLKSRIYQLNIAQEIKDLQEKINKIAPVKIMLN